jgi:hypothetical protein
MKSAANLGLFAVHKIVSEYAERMYAYMEKTPRATRNEPAETTSPEPERFFGRKRRPVPNLPWEGRGIFFSLDHPPFLNRQRKAGRSFPAFVEPVLDLEHSARH